MAHNGEGSASGDHAPTEDSFDVNLALDRQKGLYGNPAFLGIDVARDYLETIEDPERKDAEFQRVADNLRAWTAPAERKIGDPAINPPQAEKTGRTITFFAES